MEASETGYTNTDFNLAYFNVNNPAINNFLSSIILVAQLIYKNHVEQLVHHAEEHEKDVTRDNPEFVAARFLQDTFAKDIHPNVFGVHDPSDILAYYVSGKIAVLFEEALHDKQQELARKHVKLRHGNLFEQALQRDTKKGKMQAREQHFHHHILDRLLDKMYDKAK